MMLFLSIGVAAAATASTWTCTPLTTPGAVTGDGLAITDLDGDGNDDIVTANGNLGWFHNLGGGTFAAWAPAGSVPEAYALDVGDIDGDGDIDIAAWFAPDEVRWLANDGTGSFGAAQLVNTNMVLAPEGLSLRDLDADGDADLVVGDLQGVRTFINEGSSPWTTGQTLLSTLAAPRDVRTGDFDADGIVDVAIGSGTSQYYGGDNAVLWNRGLGDGHLGPIQTVGSAIEAIEAIEVADVDGDGLPDLLSTEPDTIAWYPNTGAGFAPREVIATGARSHSIAAEDIDSDGDVDLVAVHTSSSTILLWDHLGAGQFAPAVQITGAAPEPQRVRLGDLDGDLDPDLVVLTTSSVLWCENPGVPVVDTGDTGTATQTGHTGLTPSTVDTVDTATDTTVDAPATGNPGTEPPVDDGSGCGCQTADPARGWLGVEVVRAIMRRRP